MVNTESARVIDAVFTNLSEGELDKLRFKNEVLVAALGDPDRPDVKYQLTGEQSQKLKEALGRRMQVAKGNRTESLAQYIRSQLFEQMNEGDLEKTKLKLETPQQYDEVADVVLAFKRRLAKRSSYGGAGNSGQDEELNEFAEFLQGLTPEVIEELQKTQPELMTAAFGSPDGRHMMNFYSVKYLLDQGTDSQKAWEKFQKGFTLFTLPTGLDPATYETLLDEDWQDPRPENAILVEQVQAWQLMADLLPVRSGPYSQIARVAGYEYPTMGILGSTYVSKLFEAAAKVDQFAGVLKASTEDVAERIGEASPDGEQIAALLYAGRRPIVFEGKELGKAGAFEIGVARSLDVATGYTGEFKKNENSEPIYEFSYNHNGSVEVRVGTLNQVFNGLSETERKRALYSEHLNPVWDGNLFEGRLVPGERLNTMTEMMRDEKAKLPFLDDAVEQIEESMPLEEITSIWAMHEDGQQLTRDHQLFKIAYKVGLAKARLAKMEELGFDVGKWRNDLIAQGMPRDEAEKMLTQTMRSKLLEISPDANSIKEWRDYLQGLNMPNEDIENLLGDKIKRALEPFENELDLKARRYGTSKMVENVVISAYGRYPDLALGLAEVFTETALWDVQQWFDHMPELWNKMMTTMPYGEKYAILPAVTRKLVQSYIRGVLAWKRKDVDPVLVSLNGNPKSATAAWRDPLDASRAPTLPSLGLVEGGAIRKLKSSDALITLPDGRQVTGKELWLNVSTTIEAVLYTKSDWRSGYTGRMEKANHLVELAKTDPIKAEAMATNYLDDYIKKYNRLAPQEFPSDRGSAAAKLLSLSSERRACLEMVDFKPLLQAMGYQNMGLNDLEYAGVSGFSKVLEIRSNGQWLVGQVEKWFKYMSKYPGMAVVEGKLLAKVVPLLNNAINPYLEGLLGGAPDQLSTLNADQFGEALAKNVVNLLFMGRRKPQEALKFLEAISEAVAEAGNITGYMSGGEQRQNMMDIIMCLDGISDKAVAIAMHDWVGGEGEHGSSRDFLTLDFDNVSQEQAIVKALRKAGYMVIYPDKTMLEDINLENLYSHGQIAADMLPKPGESKGEKLAREAELRRRLKDLDIISQRKPYVSWGIQPVFYEKGAIDADGKWKAPPTKADALGLYGHRGKEVLQTIFLLEYMMDKLLMTEVDTKLVLANLSQFKGKDINTDRIWDIYISKRREFIEVERKAQEAKNESDDEN